MGVVRTPVRVAAGILAVLLLSACALTRQPSRDQEILDTLKMDFASQYHQCIPLGWAPVRVMKSYYPGYTSSLQNYSEWLDAMWIGSVHNSDMHRADAATVVNILNRLVGDGLLVRHPSMDGYHYYMTLAASHYFYEANLYKNNPDRVRYLCYSSVVPQKIVRTGPIHSERIGRRTVRTFRVTFEWTASPSAAWANDPYIRSHSVILAPISSPTTGNMMFVDGAWDMASLDKDEWTLPELVDPSAWRVATQSARSNMPSL